MAFSRQTKVGIYLTVMILFVTFGVYFYQILYSPNLQVAHKAPRMLYIPTGASFEQVIDSLTKHKILSDELTFRFIAKAMGYTDKVQPGAYLINPDTGNLAVVKMLINGRQSPVKLTFNNVRLKQDLAQKIGNKLELDSAQLLTRLLNPDTCRAYGFAPETVPCMFVPNTYELYWNISGPGLWKRMLKEYGRFWTEERKAKAEALKLTQVEVITLASIVQAETQKRDEMPTIAGVYLNRLRIGMKLQADPTVVFATGDFTIRRVREKHRITDSPYNTYMYEGLPPGPVNLPGSAAIDATLSPQAHEFLFFVARPDLSGYHDFSKDFNSHVAKANAYRGKLDEMKL